MNEKNAVVPVKSDVVEYTPLGADDAIKLSVNIIQRLIATPTRSGAVCGERDALKFLMMCRSRRLNPFEGDAYLVGFDSKDGPSWSLITAHVAFLKRAELHPEFDGLKSGVFVMSAEGTVIDREGDFHFENEKLLGGWATVFFKSRKVPMSKRTKLETYRKSFGMWLTDPAGMICKVAEADALRSAFPTMCAGLYLREEIELQPKTPSALNLEREFDSTSAAAPNEERPAGNNFKMTLDPPRGDGIFIPPGAGKAETKAPVHEEFQQFLDEHGISFSVFQHWAESEQMIADARSKASLAEIDGKILARLLRAKTGLIAGLKQAQEAVQ